MPRSLELKAVLHDNFALEQLIGSAVAERAGEDKDYYERFLKKFGLDWSEFFYEDPEKDAEVSQMMHGIDFSKNSWKYDYSRILERIASSEEDPFFAAYLMQNMAKERGVIYSEDVVSLLTTTIKKT
jgi:hypothetical protein